MTNLLTDTIKRLEQLLQIVPANIEKISSDELNFRRAPDKWSQKEIIGHLCDSAINNLSRFIKAQFEAKPFEVTTYDQDEWVKAAHYQDMSVNEVLAFWESVNRNIIYVIKNYAPDMLQYECFIADGEFGNYTKEEIPEYTASNGMRTLHWLIDDYAAHMEYHLKQIPGVNIEL